MVEDRGASGEAGLDTAEAGVAGDGKVSNGVAVGGRLGSGRPGSGIASEAAASDDVELLRALAHPVRWGILSRLAAEPGICACDFTEFFAVSQPTVSAHLKVLREAGLVTTRRRGTTICYTLASGPLAALATRLAAMAATAPAGTPQAARS